VRSADDVSPRAREVEQRCQRIGQGKVLVRILQKNNSEGEQSSCHETGVFPGSRSCYRVREKSSRLRTLLKGSYQEAGESSRIGDVNRRSQSEQGGLGFLGPVRHCGQQVPRSALLLQAGADKGIS
jgi:hypothetical protein